MFPRLHTPLSTFRTYYRSGRRPSRLTLGVAAATAATAAGSVAAGLSASATPAVTAASKPHAISTPGTAQAASQVNARNARAATQPAPARHTAGKLTPAQLPFYVSAGVRPASRQHAGIWAAVQHPAAAQHPAAQHLAAPALAAAPAQPAAQHPAAPAPAQHPAAPAPAQHPAAPAPAQHPAAPAPAQRPAAPAPPAVPYLMYDSVTPGAIPPNGVVATYATGPYAASPEAVAGRQVMWIDVYGTDYNAQALDIEPSDATPQVAANWVYQRLILHPNALAHLYTNISEWPAVQAAVAPLPLWMREHIRWWIADPTGVPHIVPGASATQWYWGQNYDISTAAPGF